MAILHAREKWKRKPSEARMRRELGTLTIEEQTNVRRAIRILRARFGSTAKLAAAMGMTTIALQHAAVPSQRPSARLATLVARIVGVPVGEILSGAWPKACPACGRA